MRQEVLDYGAEIVVVATGSYWATDGLQGVTNEPIPGADASLAHVATPEQMMVEGKAVGQRVVIYDCETYFIGVGLAEKLAREGKTSPTSPRSTRSRRTRTSRSSLRG